MIDPHNAVIAAKVHDLAAITALTNTCYADFQTATTDGRG